MTDEQKDAADTTQPPSPEGAAEPAPAQPAPPAGQEGDAPPLSRRNAILLGVGVVLIMGFAWFFLNPKTDPKKPTGGAAPPPVALPKPPAIWDVTPEQGKTMTNVLLNDSLAEKKVWIHAAAGNPEVDVFRRSLEKVFGQAGWTVSSKVITSFRLKPGIFFFVATEADPPEYVTVAYTAMKSAGIEAVYASGYRAYSETMKQQNPGWSGIELAADQEFAIVLGPKPQ